MVKTPRLVIGAPHGRSGKTTLTLGLLRALKRNGKIVQPFKKGPDFIDPGWHSIAAGRVSLNLDTFFMNSEQIKNSLIHAAQGSRLSIIEGSMGLFDGLDLNGSSSTAEIAKITQSPVLMVMDVTRMTRTAAALIMGCQHFDPEIRIAGVILNKVVGLRQEKLIREAIEKFCNIPVIGVIPKDNRVAIPDRHLGLISSTELEKREMVLEELADIIAENVDLKAIFSIADSAETLTAEQVKIHEGTVHELSTKRPRIAVIKDPVFCFYYPENLKTLEDLGAELVMVNSLIDDALPESIDALYIGGGFPEMFAAQLELNTTLKNQIKSFAEMGLPIYAECGGIMYLGRSICCDGRVYKMVGALPLDTIMENKRQGHGYTVLKACAENSWFPPDTLLKGHEFHYSRIINLDPEVKFGYEVVRGHGIDGEHDGLIYKGIHATYNHIHAMAVPQWANSFINKACAKNIASIGD